MKPKHNIFVLSLFFGLLLYLIDALIDFLIFRMGTFWGSLFLDVPAHEIYMRIIMVAGFLAFGIVISRILAGRHRAEEALKQSEEAAQRLANQTEIIAEIGRIITSTFNIEEVYEGFAEKVKMLIPYDRIVICHKIVERHGGKIWVESEPGKGAHFRSTLSYRRRE